MVDIFPIQNPPAIGVVPFESAAPLSSPIQTSQTDANGFVRVPIAPALEAAAIANAPQQEDTQPTIIVSGPLNLDTPSLILLNDIETAVENTTIEGALTPEQRQALQILQDDVQRLENAALQAAPLPLTNAATTVALSNEAQSIADTGALASTTTDTSLTSAQLARIGRILEPFANEPLTPSLLTEIQARFEANHFNANQLSLHTLFMVHGYLAGLQSAAITVEKAAPATTSQHAHSIAPVSAISRTGIENGNLPT